MIKRAAVLLTFVLFLNVSSIAQSFDGPAELPRTVPIVQQSLTPSSNIPIYVAPGANLQAILNTAKPGDNIVIDPMWSGTIASLPNGAPGQWITVRTASLLIPDENTRIKIGRASCR